MKFIRLTGDDDIQELTRFAGAVYLTDSLLFHRPFFPVKSFSPYPYQLKIYDHLKNCGAAYCFVFPIDDEDVVLEAMETVAKIHEFSAWTCLGSMDGSYLLFFSTEEDAMLIRLAYQGSPSA